MTNQSYGFAYATIDVGVASVSRPRPGDAVCADPTVTRRIVELIEIAGVDRRAESSVVIEARIKVAPGAQAGVRREMLRRRLKLRFYRDGIGLAVPRVTLVAQKEQQAKPAEGIHS